MALPTIGYTYIAPAADSGQHAKVFEALSALLEAAGWTRRFIDSDAIGTGSAAAPKWDAVTPAASAVAGRAIYSMPANGHSREWYIEITPDWTNGDDEPAWRFYVGTGIDGSDNLTGASSLFQMGNDSPVSITEEVVVCASEDGFALAHCGSSGISFRFFCCERVRDVDGTVLDDLVVIGTGSTSGVDSSWPDASTAAGEFYYYGNMQVFDATTGAAYAGQIATCLSSDVSTTGGDGTTNIPIGWFPTRPQLRGFGRHALFVASDDAVEGSIHPVYIDGAVQDYQTLYDNGQLRGRILIARE